MNRIDKKLAQLQLNRKKMLSPYITAGDPQIEATVPLMHTLAEAGADILELGIPFSDPMAEGIVIQHAMERALAQKITTNKIFSLVHEFRQKNENTPVVLMGYLNTIEQYGYRLFAEHAKQAGVDGTILVDLPPEEATLIQKIWQENGLYSIFLCSPTTTTRRMELINNQAQGYLYYVSLKGVTGANNLDLRILEQEYTHHKAQTSLPLMVGFGIKTPEMAADVAQFADGVIVGAALISTIVEAYNNGQDMLSAAAQLITAMRQALDANIKIN